MLIKKCSGGSETRGRSRKTLQFEMMETLIIVTVISVFCYLFFYYTATNIIEQKMGGIADDPRPLSSGDLHLWTRLISVIASFVIFIALFIFLMGQKTIYISKIIKGVENLKNYNLDYILPVEGNDELATLAESINYLSDYIKEYIQTENQLKEEKLQFMRSLSHDIRNPLTSIISYSELMLQGGVNTDFKNDEYLAIIRDKSLQIKEITDRLLDRPSAGREFVSQGSILMLQLAEAFDGELEADFDVRIDSAELREFEGDFDIGEMRRVFDNLASNVRKYADLAVPVTLKISLDRDILCIAQSNRCREKNENEESNKLGIVSIRKIAEAYGGNVTVARYDGNFEIIITMQVTPAGNR